MADENGLATAKRIALRLHALATEVADAESSRRAQHREDDDAWLRSPDAFDQWVHDWRGLGPVVEVIESLDQALEEVGFDAQPPPIGPWDFFSLGTMTLYGQPREILRGFVQLVLRLPIAPRLPARVVAFLTRIPGDDEWLEGENHSNLGYHYHYLNTRKERSDIAICWDTRAALRTPHPLFQEKHGEAHSRFPGRPDLWREPKRQSIHEACATDLKRWTLDKFRMACDKAGPVWPLGAVLTPRPAQKAIAPRFPSKKGKAKWR